MSENTENKEINENIKSVESVSTEKSDAKNVKDVKDAKDADIAKAQEKISTEELEKITKEIIEQESKKPKTKEKKSYSRNIFVTEDNTFDVDIEYYSYKNSFKVKGVDDDFDPENDQAEVENFVVTLKYPSQLDSEIVAGTIARQMQGSSSISLIDFITLDLARLNVLLRSWSLEEDISEISKLHPKIIKGILEQIRQKIGSDGTI